MVHSLVVEVRLDNIGFIAMKLPFFIRKTFKNDNFGWTLFKILFSKSIILFFRL